MKHEYPARPSRKENFSMTKPRKYTYWTIMYRQYGEGMAERTFTSEEKALAFWASLQGHGVRLSRTDVLEELGS